VDYIIPWDQLASLKLQTINNSDRSSFFCSSIISKYTTSTNKIYLGSKFLKNYIVIVDKQKARIGFAQKNSDICTPSGIIYLINTISYIDSAVEYLSVTMSLIVFFLMINECIDFYDVDDVRDENTLNTSEQSSQEGTTDQKQQAQELSMEEVRNDVAEAIQYTQNEDGTMRVIDGVGGLIEEIKKEKEHFD